MADATEWSDVVADALVAADFSFARPERFRGRVTQRRLGPASLIAMVAHPHVAVREAEHIASGAPSETLLSLQLEGHAEFRQDGRTATVSPGDLVFYDSARPVEIVAREGYRSLCFRFPTSGPGGHRRPEPLTATTLRGAHGLAPAVAGLLTGLQSSTGGTAALAASAQQAAELARTLFDDELARRGLLTADEPHDALRAAFDEHVDAHLADPDLTPRSAAAALFVSPRLLHAVLAEDGRTPAGTIRTRRLDRCLADLADPAAASTPVSAVARRWGFPNATRFGQLVRARTGRTPTAYRRAMLG
ncbi:helix-turn-helix domain-containing protein [Actinomycetospora corticicola]|uniref:AraC-like DNA-binding protein n=1 Tax=Actinomycetospora corticicola TaxID=663602 RepID=A0A7Y9E259_9PSEU|nr:helix-turn-helix domain-containing protein [Actinomycetospora corticicola]NYD39874.1 AraC-like DNA-binding protein [Actinomycetospora corticicola]